MASSTPACGICNIRDITKPSIIWCFECDEGLCPECKDHHNLSKETRNHQAITIREYQKLPIDIVKITQNCDKHNEKFTMYCKKHECLCCGSCIVENHIKCRDIDKLAEICQNTKLSYACYGMEQSLEDISDNIQRIRNDRENNMKRLSEKKTQIEQEIKQTRITINNHLDKIQDDIMKKLNAAEERESKSISNLLNALKENESETAEYRKTIENIKQHASELQTFIFMKELEKKVSIKVEFLQSVIDSEIVKNLELSYSPYAAMQKFSNHIKSFGEVIIETKPCDVVLTRRKDKQAQQMLRHITHVTPNSVGKINLKLLESINVMGNYPSGCCMLPDCRMVFSDNCNQLVKIFNKDGIKDFEVFIPTRPCDVAYISEDNTLAVTSERSNCSYITIIDIQNKCIKNKIPVYSEYYGIDVKDGKLFCSAFREGIHLIDPVNKTLREIVQDECPWGCYVATFDDNVYYTNKQTNSVICYDLQGKQQWLFKNESVLKHPRGISVDDYGNVYVVGDWPNIVVVISANGQQHKEILTANDGYFSAKSIDYSKSTNQLLVANNEEAMIFTLI